MSLFKLDDDDRENFTLVTNPLRTFASSSSTLTGSLYVYARRNRITKEVEQYFSGATAFDEIAGVNEKLLAARRSFITGSTTNVFDGVKRYVDTVNAQSLSTRLNSTVGVTRTVPGTTISENFLRKMSTVDSLMPYYKSTYPSSDFSVGNFNCINFFTASGLSSSTAIIYPVSYSANTPQQYVPSGEFTIDLHLNPRYTSPRNTTYRAGTILHVSSTFALSIVTGSGVDEYGRRRGFRVLLQLSHSADTTPSTINLSTANNARAFPNDLTFLSDDNALNLNSWHHVAVRWGTNTKNHGTGAFFIDGVQKGTFSVPSSSIRTALSGAGALYVGNYFQGPASIDQRRFFNSTVSTNEGVTQLSTLADPTGFTFTHPPNVEMHGLRITPKFMSQQEILTASNTGQASVGTSLFFLPVAFVSESRARSILTTPFYSTSKKTSEPLNADLLFGVDGHIVNCDNYLREFSRGEYPRLYNMTASVNTGSFVSGKTADDHLYDAEAVKRRNLLILPCDNGKFTPNFDILLSGSKMTVPTVGTPMSRFVTDVGGLDLRIVTLRNQVNESLLLSSVSGGLESQVFGASPENMSVAQGSVPAVFQRTRDSSSNSIVMFNVPSLYYGRRILPGSLTLTDTSITGSSGMISFTLRDDGHGNIYRADAKTTHAKWNSVGNIYYNEGVILIKTPLIPHFGKNQFTMAFRGEHHTYVSRLNLVAQASMVNSSSNPSFRSLSPSGNANDAEDDFVYITGINIHDENLNVVARTNLAQPVIKRGSEKIMFRVKLDW